MWTVVLTEKPRSALYLDHPRLRRYPQFQLYRDAVVAEVAVVVAVAVVAGAVGGLGPSADVELPELPDPVALDGLVSAVVVVAAAAAAVDAAVVVLAVRPVDARDLLRLTAASIVDRTVLHLRATLQP